MNTRRVRRDQLTDRAHMGRAARVSAGGTVSAASAWLAELDLSSPTVEDLVDVMAAA